MRTRARTYPVSATYIAFNIPVTRHNPISCSSTIGATHVTNTRNSRSFKLLPSVNLYHRRMPLPTRIPSYASLLRRDRPASFHFLLGRSHRFCAEKFDSTSRVFATRFRNGGEILERRVEKERNGRKSGRDRDGKDGVIRWKRNFE